MNIEEEVAVLDAIASGKAIALIGSGPSCEMGYASWGQLAKAIGHRVASENSGFDLKTYNSAVEGGQYPEAFEFAQKATSRQFICQAVDGILKPSATGSDALYKVLARLPIACFLTTNFDDELKTHLDAAGKSFVVALNSKDDLSTFRDDMVDVIYKIHGDMHDPQSVVLTSDDYSSLTLGPERSYFRERLKMLFGMKRSIIIGYSLADRDLSIIFECLKKVSSELSPSYIFLPDPDPIKVWEYSQRYGIHIIPYRVKGSSHAALCRKLEMYAAFLTKSTAVVARASEDSKKAAGLYMFRILKKQSRGLDLENYILMSIPSSSENGIGEGVLFAKCAIAQKGRLQELLSVLEQKKLVLKRKGLYNRTEQADDLVNEAQASFSKEKEFAIAQFLEKLSIPECAKEGFVELLHECLTSIFEKRGDAIVKSIFEQSNCSSGAAVDIYQSILPFAQKVSPIELCGVFIQSVYDFIIHPSSHQKTYLVSLAQGYFLYHMMGKEAQREGLMQEAFQHSVWYVDSNLLIPLVANGCANNAYARDMFAQIKGMNLRMIVIPSVIEEVRRHLEWAKENDPDRRRNDSVFSVLNSQQQNLFIDGYIRMRSEGRVKSFRQYASSIEIVLYNNAANLMKSYGLKYENPRDSSSWQDEEFKRICMIIEERRRKTASYRRDFQIRTDAELLYAMRLRIARNRAEGEKNSVRFFSQSTLFSAEEEEIKTWSGEAMYRLLQFASPVMSSSETLQECLQNELYNIGIEFIDQKKYADFFREEIDMAELKFANQREEFMRFLSEPDADDFQRRFEELPDLQKPIFIRQMEEKSVLITGAKINELKESLSASRAENERITLQNVETQSEIERLKKELRKKDAALRAKEGEVRNLKNGTTFKRLAKRHKGKKR